MQVFCHQKLSQFEDEGESEKDFLKPKNYNSL